MIETFEGKQVVILGLARQGVALARFFAGEGAKVTISDLAPAGQLAEPLAQLAGIQVNLVLGDHPLSLLDGCDLLCLSGGVPPQIPLVRAARRQGISLSNDAILTLALSPAPTIGITGSSGKTTTTTLAGLMLAAQGYALPDSHTAGHRVWVGGNIGTPLIDRLDLIEAGDYQVLELSSFQLELFDDGAGGRSVSPHVAAVLNVTPNHLDRHPSMAHYVACKANILRWQGGEDVRVLGADDAITGRWLRTGRVTVDAGAGQEAVDYPLAGRCLGFGLGDPQGEGCWLQEGRLVLRLDGQEFRLMDLYEIRLPGLHNALNVMAACSIAAVAGVEPAAMAQVAASFSGVPHRLELVRELGGVRWINDSIATTPERAVAALRSYREPIVLLAGGRDKKLPWQEFARLAQERVRQLVLFGEAARLIAHAVLQYQSDHGGRQVPIISCADLPEAVAAAFRVAQAGEVVLLSPGGTSFDAYKDFEARGRHFRELVQAL